MQIDSTRNESVKLLKSLATPKGRAQTGLFVIEGTKLVEDALLCGWEIERCLYDPARCAEQAQACARAGARVMPAGEAALAAATQTGTPQGIVCALRLPSGPIAPLTAPVLALDGVQDPGNVGTMLRTADAAGFGGVVLGAGCADPFSPKVVRSTMGSIFRIPVEMTDDLACYLNNLRAQGWCVAASALQGGDFFERQTLQAPSVLVIGSEGRGVSDAVLACADVVLSLPMAGGAESLNAAVAAGIMMYDWYRRKDGKGINSPALLRP